MNISKQQWILLQRYVSGHATGKEKISVEHWMAQDPANRKMVQELEEIWVITPEEDFEVDVEAAWHKFKTSRKRKTFKRAKNLHAKNSNLVYVFRAAAVILVTFFAGFFVQHFINTTVIHRSDQVSDFPVMQNLETGQGEKARVTFSDGTEVTLNASSSIRFPEEFHESRREVYLDGEAFFSVAQNSERAFIVHARHAQIKVLGTEFNIRGWREDPGLDVTVMTGKVSVSSTEEGIPNSETILEAGNYTRVIEGHGPEPVQEVDPAYPLLWTNGGMYFDNVPFEQVVRDIERRFNVEVSASDVELMGIHYTGTFQYAELDEVLSVIAATMKLEYVRDGNYIEFYSSHVNNG